MPILSLVVTENSVGGLLLVRPDVDARAHHTESVNRGTSPAAITSAAFAIVCTYCDCNSRYSPAGFP